MAAPMQYPAHRGCTRNQKLRPAGARCSATTPAQPSGACRLGGPALDIVSRGPVGVVRRSPWAGSPARDIAAPSSPLGIAALLLSAVPVQRMQSAAVYHSQRQQEPEPAPAGKRRDVMSNPGVQRGGFYIRPLIGSSWGGPRGQADLGNRAYDI